MRRKGIVARFGRVDVPYVIDVRVVRPYIRGC